MMEERRNGNGRRSDDDLVRRMVTLEQDMGRVFDELLGPQLLRMDGTPYREKTQGLIYKVDQIVDRDGVKARLPLTAWVAISVAIIAGVFQLGAAFVG